MNRTHLAAAAAAAAALAAPTTASAATGSIYDVTRASGHERLTFSGDENSGCAGFGVCGHSGVVTYRPGGAARGTLVLRRGRNGRLTGRTTYRTRGTTNVSMTMPIGQECEDTRTHRSDNFAVSTQGSELVLDYHAAATDFLATDCPNPTESLLETAGAEPSGSFERSRLGPAKVKLRLAGTLEFRRGGYAGSSNWDLTFRLKGRSCNPRCRLR